MSGSVTPRFSSYDDPDITRRHVADGQHRAVIGGLWEELGSLQLEFLKKNGLKPRHAFIDVGAGSFRAGVKLIPYLNVNNYYAIDIQQSLLEGGYAQEIGPAGLARRFPRKNFAANGAFDVSMFNRTFDFGIAQSVFTHMPINRLAYCLAALEAYFQPGGVFFATMFLADEAVAPKPVRHVPGDIVTFPDHDPFHTTISSVQNLVSPLPHWQMRVIGDWCHPRNQQMLCFTRR